MYKSYRLNKLSRFNRLITLNSNFNYCTKKKETLVISQKCMPEISMIFKHECSEKKNANDKSIDNSISLIKNRVIPILGQSVKENTIILFWNIYDEVSKKQLDKQDPIFECIKEYEIFGQTIIYNPEISKSSDMEELDNSKWLSVIFFVLIFFISYFFF